MLLPKRVKGYVDSGNMVESIITITVQVQVWAIPPIILTTLVKFAQHEDEVVKHYATKAIENVLV